MAERRCRPWFDPGAGSPKVQINSDGYGHDMLWLWVNLGDVLDVGYSFYLIFGVPKSDQRRPWIHNWVDCPVSSPRFTGFKPSLAECFEHASRRQMR